jgi:hypothetical protein
MENGRSAGTCEPEPMDPIGNIALVAGAFAFVTFAASIPQASCEPPWRSRRTDRRQDDRHRGAGPISNGGWAMLDTSMDEPRSTAHWAASRSGAAK